MVCPESEFKNGLGTPSGQNARMHYRGRPLSQVAQSLSLAFRQGGVCLDFRLSVLSEDNHFLGAGRIATR